MELIEIKGAYPEWVIRFKDSIYPIHIPTRVRSPEGKGSLKNYIIGSLDFAMGMRWFKQKCKATESDIEQIWDKFCEYNKWN